MSKIDLLKIKTSYFIGIKGAGMTALAQMFRRMGIKVGGSDVDEKFFTDKVLRKEKIKVYHYFNEKNIPEKVDLIVYSTAYGENNPEFKKAKKSKLPMLSYAECLGLLMDNKTGIAVCGTHGKTTITSMAGLLLAEAKFDPSVIVGSYLKEFGGNARVGKSDYLVIEADEYQNKLKYYKPKIVILNNIDFDHPDFYPTIREYKQAFEDFVCKLDKDAIIIANFDDKNVRDAVRCAKAKVISFGKSDADYFIQLSNKAVKGKFSVFHKNKNLGEYKLKVLGEFNILNSLSVIVLGDYLGIDNKIIKKSLAKFTGAERRLEKKGKFNGALIIDDYAHHPKEILATLKALKDKYPKKYLYCIFHPHSYSRTESLFEAFAGSFREADKVIVLDIYGSAREKCGLVHSRDLVKKINENFNKDKALYISTISECVKFLAPKIKKGDIVLTMGAGDVWKLGKKLLSI